MTAEPKISVIIPIYNTAEYLACCLDSILHNTYRNLEIICVNDGSTDNSLIILEQYAAEDSRIVAVNQGNAGVSAARNTGLDKATGDFIAFVDSDDWVHPQYFEILMHFMSKTAASVVACNYSHVIDATPNQKIDISTCKPVYLNFNEIMSNGYLKRIIWGRIYKKTYISGLRFPKGIKWGEDTIFNVSALCSTSSAQVVIVDVPLYFYLQRENSAVNTTKTIDKIPVCQFYLNQGVNENDKIKQEVYLSECAKQLLAHRYTAKVCAEQEAYRQCEITMNECISALRQIKTTPKKIMFLFYFYCPWIYRLYRIIDDPTLLVWEKNEKNKLKGIDRH